MQIYQIDLSGVGGIVPSSPKSLEQLVYFGKDNQTVSGFYNPFPYPGYMAPLSTVRRTMSKTQNTPLEVTCLFDFGTGKFMSASTDGYINVWSSPDSTSASSVIDLGSRSIGIYDFEVYQLNGVRKVFFTSFNNPNGFVGVTDGTTATYNWSNGATSSLYTGSVTGAGTFSAVPFLRVASNGFMYIFESSNVHKVDGTTAGGSAGTITANVLTVNSSLKITDAVDWRNMMYIGVQDQNLSTSTYPLLTGLPDQYNFQGNCGVYIWDRVSTQVGTRDFIPIYGAKKINRIFVAHDGRLRLICTTSDNKTQLREFTGSSFEVIFEMNYNAAPTGYWDSLFINGYGTFWVCNDQSIYCHGKPGYGFDNAVYRVGKVFGTTQNFSIGYLYFASVGEENGSEAYFTSSIDSISAPNSRVTKIFFNFSGTPSGSSTGGGYADGTIIKTKVFDLPFLSNIGNINVFFAPITGSTGTAVRGAIKVYFNNSTTAFKTQNVTLNDLAKGYITIPINKQFVNNIQFGIDYTTADAYTSFGIGTEMMPKKATFEYFPTATKK